MAAQEGGAQTRPDRLSERRRQGREFGSASMAGTGAGGKETKLQRAAEKTFVFLAEHSSAQE